MDNDCLTVQERAFDSDEGECEECGEPTHNGAGQRIHCDCTWVPVHLDW